MGEHTVLVRASLVAMGREIELLQEPLPCIDVES